MRKSIFSTIILILVLTFVIGCSSANNSPITSGSSSFDSQIGSISNTFTEGPVDKPYGEYTIIGDSFLIDSNAGLHRLNTASNPTGNNVLVKTDGISFNKSDLSGSVNVSFQNDSEIIIYDAHLVLDEINPLGSEAIEVDAGSGSLIN